MTALQIRQTTVYFISFLIFGLALSLLGIALPFLAGHTGISLSRAGLLFTVSSIGFGSGSYIAGTLYDRFRGNLILAITWLVLSIVTYIIPVISIFPLLCVLIFFNAFGNGTVVVGCNTLITYINQEKTSSLMSGMHLFNGIGALMTPLIFSWVILRTDDIIVGYRIFSVIFLIAAIYSALTPSPGKDLLADRETAKQQDKRSKNGNEKGQEKPGSRNLLLVLIIITFLIYIGGESSFNGWIFTYIRTLFPSMSEQAGLITSAFWGCVTLGRLVTVFLTRRVNPRLLLQIDFFGAGAGLLIIIFGSKSMPLIWTGTIVSGCFMGAVFPLMMAFTGEAVKLTGKLTGILFAGIALGGMVFPYMNGQLFALFSPRAIMISILCCTTTSGVLFAVLRRMVRSKHAHSQNVHSRSEA